ncbi:GntR family transcriptional regulator [Jiangella sp. DSM 45060]|uniref:GntR family transcriptional regulator n=1 Tax=Jiangella sp. DSM 45060 TaxID=1798224 RepID=UPI00087CA490|nr:GntR family transcriptional regulator [Jiangella sp. DSM 45060]SDT11438.1 DNA-binding transcriptional regulator, GntR family [Jiangella sp. DSM 45060]
MATETPRFDELPRTKLRDAATDQIKAQIIAGTLKPGELYSISTISDQLRVSATPVREAVLDLAKDGLVEMVRNRGFRVRVLGDKDLDDIVELRLALEVPAMERLASRRPAPDVEPLRPLARDLVRLAEEGDMVGFVAVDRQFHLAVTALLGNDRYVAMVALLRDQMRLLGLSGLEGDRQLVASAREHEQLLDLIAAGDADGTRTLMTQHLQHARGLWAGRPEEPADD